MQHPRITINQGLLIRARAFPGPWLLEFYDAFEDLQAVAFSEPKLPGAANVCFRSDKLFLDKLIAQGYGRRFDLLRAPMPLSKPGRIRVRQALDGKCLLETERAAEIWLHMGDTPVGLFYRALSDDTWVWAHDQDKDWKVTLSKLASHEHRVIE